MTVPASRLTLPPGPWRTVLEALCARFPRIPESQWRDRFIRGRVLDGSGAPLPLDTPYRPGAQVQYFREVAEEPALPGGEYVVHCDGDLLVARTGPGVVNPMLLLLGGRDDGRAGRGEASGLASRS